MKSLDGGSKKSSTSNEAAPVVEEKIDFSKVEIEPLFADAVDFETFSKSDFRAVKVKERVAVPKSKKLLQFTLDDGTGTERTILSGIHAFYEPEELVGKTLIAITNLPPRAMMGIESNGMLLSAVHNEEGEEKLPVPVAEYKQCLTKRIKFKLHLYHNCQPIHRLTHIHRFGCQIYPRTRAYA